jgi:hypothetical protein
MLFCHAMRWQANLVILRYHLFSERVLPRGETQRGQEHGGIKAGRRKAQKPGQSARPYMVRVRLLEAQSSGCTTTHVFKGLLGVLDGSMRTGGIKRKLPIQATCNEQETTKRPPKYGTETM